MNTQEQKQELLNKWFPKEELENLKNELKSTEIIFKHPMFASADLYTNAEFRLKDIAEEKENIFNAIYASLDGYMEYPIVDVLLDALQSSIDQELEMDGDLVPEEVALDKSRLINISNKVYSTVNLIKTISYLIRHFERIRFLKIKVDHLKEGIIT